MPLHGTEIEAQKKVLPPTGNKSTKVLIISNLWFVLASVFYLAAAIVDVQDNNNVRSGQPLPQGDGLTTSTILLILGGLGFVVVGLLDLYNTSKKVHIFLTLAGLFAALRGFYVKSNPPVAAAFNALSSHLFLLESVDWLYSHCVSTKLEENDSRKMSLLVAHAGDFFFFVGALMDCVFSWYDVFTPPSPLGSQASLATAWADVFSSVLWLLAAIFATALACRLGKDQFAGAATGNDATPLKEAAGSMA